MEPKLNSPSLTEGKHVDLLDYTDSAKIYFYFFDLMFPIGLKFTLLRKLVIFKFVLGFTVNEFLVTLGVW